MHNPRMAFGLLTVGLVLLVAISAALERLGVSGAVLSIPAALLLIGVCAFASLQTRTMNAAAYLRTRRHMPPSFDGMACFMNGLAGLAIAFLLLGGSFEESGFAAIVTGWAGGLFLHGFLVAEPLRRSGAGTLPEFFALRFDNNLPRLSALVIQIAVSFGLFCALIGLSRDLLLQLLPVPQEAGLWIILFLLLGGGLLGGARSVSWMQANLFVFLLLSMAVAILWAAIGPGWEQAAHAAPVAADPAIETAWLSGCVAMGTAAMPHIATRSLMSPTPLAARRSSLWSMVMLSVVVVTAYAIGYTALPTDPDVPTFVRAAAAAGMLASALALALGLVITVSNTLGHDLFVRWSGRAETAPQRLFAKRASLVLVVLAGGWAASSSFRSPVDEMIWSIALAAAGLAVPLIGAIWWRRASGMGAFAGMAAGICAAIALLYYERFGGLAWMGLDPARIGLTGMAVSLIAFVGVSLATAESARDLRERFRRLHLE